jgi:RNA polymerase sigma-70 factor, ECF subfamily
MVQLEQELRSRFQEGDLDTLRIIVERYQGSLYRLGLRLLGDAEAARDLAQDTFVRVYERRRQYRPELAFEPWLYRVAVNLARSGQRRRRAWPAGDDLPETPVAPEAEERLLQEERRGRVRQALGQIDPIYREVLGLRFESEFSLAQIAEVLGLALGTVKSRLHRGLHFFHAMYQNLGGDER